jgi:hypothetical protein
MARLQQKFARFRAAALRNFGSFIEVDGVSLPCVLTDSRVDRPREDGGFFEGRTLSATIFKRDLADALPLINGSVLLDGIPMRVVAVEDQPMAQAWSLVLAEPDQ